MTRQVIVPLARDRAGHATKLGMRDLDWQCPVCGEPRGEPTLEAPPYFMSLPKYKQTPRHVWANPCRHHDPLGQHRSSGPADGVA